MERTYGRSNLEWIIFPKNARVFAFIIIMSSRRALQRLLVISRSNSKHYNVIIPKLTHRFYATRNKRIEASMGGIFEPFLDDKM